MSGDSTSSLTTPIPPPLLHNRPLIQKVTRRTQVNSIHWTRASTKRRKEWWRAGPCKPSLKKYSLARYLFYLFGIRINCIGISKVQKKTVIYHSNTLETSSAKAAFPSSSCSTCTCSGWYIPYRCCGAQSFMTIGWNYGWRRANCFRISKWYRRLLIWRPCSNCRKDIQWETKIRWWRKIRW